ncbi:hypothetical protein FSP39_011087 [Pinctada imbricata]|uniref:Fucosyltransferase n=1 Tax=Pinctada imbricata TaxID=66713 RepID=A0AA88Y6I8_PINIB|nr:hypothetical protein FSP39_011087 [Pinctada imbricata]
MRRNTSASSRTESNDQGEPITEAKPRQNVDSLNFLSVLFMRRKLIILSVCSLVLASFLLTKGFDNTSEQSDNWHGKDPVKKGENSDIDPSNKEKTPVPQASDNKADIKRDGHFQRTPNLLWWTFEGGRISNNINCGEIECLSTVDRALRDHDDTKVFIFYGTGVELADLPLPRRKHDLWFLTHEESPKNNDHLFSHPEIMTLFNYTSTFKRQSDYPIPTQWLPNLSYLKSRQFLKSTATKNEFQKSDNLAPILYVQSDCNTCSDRDSYVKMLQQHIKVDSYGQCLHNKDMPDHLQFKDSMAGMHHNDFFELTSRYKFTLAMENAICDDYITEKVWRPLHLGSVPILFSSPKIKDFLPTNNSGILIEDFERVEDLAAFIKRLNEDDEEYNKYLSFKNSNGITNIDLVRHMRDREWGQNEHGQHKKYNNHFSAFECFACKIAHRHLHNIEKKLPLKPSIASVEHYGCPPPKRFDSNGKHIVDDKRWTEPFLYSKYMAKAFRYSYDKGVILKEKYLKQQAKYLRSKDGE